MDHQTSTVVSRWLAGLLTVLLVGNLAAQCPPPGTATKVLAGNEIPRLLQLAVSLSGCPKQEDTLGFVQHKLGLLYNRRGDQLDSAIYFTRLAVNTREGLEDWQGSILSGKSNYNLGEFLRLRGSYTDAEPYLQRSITILQQMGEGEGQKRLLRAQTALQQVYGSLGEFGRAEEILKLVTLSAKQLADTLAFAYAKYDQGDILMKQGDFDAAAYAFQALGDSLSRWEAVASAQTGGYLNNLQPYRQHSLGTCLTETGQYKAAEHLYQQAIPVFLKWKDHDNLSRAYHDLAFQCIEEGRRVEARSYLRLEKDRAMKSGSADNLAFYYNNQGAYGLQTGDFRSAAKNFQLAQQVILPGYSPTGLAQAPPKNLITDATNLPYLLTNIRDQAQAIDSLIEGGTNLRLQQLKLYSAADQLADRMRSSHDARASKLFWRAEVLPLYEAAIARCYELGDGALAFYFFEKSKAVLLHDALLKSDALSALPDSLRSKERELTGIVTQLTNSVDTKDLEKLAIARLEMEQLRTKLRTNFPAFRALTTVPETYNHRDFHERILKHSKQTYIHYFWGSRRVYALLVVDGVATVIDLGDALTLGKLTRQVLTFFEQATNLENTPSDYGKAASALYQRLIKPLGISAGAELLITPDGPLTYLPFPALLTDTPKSDRFGEWPYLTLRNPLSYAHSAAIMMRAQGEVTAPVSITAFAPFTDGSSTLKYPVLAFSNDELGLISKRFKTKLVRDKDARVFPFTKEREGGVIHVSSHAFSSPDETAPYIAFHDRVMYLDELYTADISAELVVLSACQTNVGKLAPGEGVLGLSRGFIQAGAESVVASLWNVNAKAGGEILTGFYDELGSNTPRSTALHRAQHRFLTSPGTRDRGKNPYYWAGLTYYGPNTPLPLQKAPRSRWSWSLLLIPLLIAFLVFRKH